MKQVSLQPFCVPWQEGTNLPKEKRLLADGPNPTTKGVLRIGSKTRALFAVNQKAAGFEQVVIDFEHNTLPGTDAYKASVEPREIAAYTTPELRPDGLWLTAIEWTKAGIEKARNYVDLSPAPALTPEGEVIFLHSVGLCRNGAVYGCHAFSAADGVQTDLPVQTERTAEEEKTIMEKILAALRKGLGLEDKADEAAIAKALEGVQLASFSAKLADIEAKLATKADVPKEPEKKVEAFTAEAGAKLLKDFADLRKALDDHERADLVTQAAREGKVLPLNAEQVAATPIATLRDIVAKLDVTVPLDKRTPAIVSHSAVLGRKMLTEEQKAIAKQCGIDPKKVEESLNG